MIDLRGLRALRAVASEGGVSRAAEALGYTPSAVSQQLAALEREMGAALLERIGRGVRLTLAGEALVDRSYDVFARLELARAEAAAHAERTARAMRIAAFATAIYAIVPSALSELRHDHPGLEVQLTEMEPEESLTAVALGKVDLAVAHEYSLLVRRQTPGLYRTELLSEPLYLVQAGQRGRRKAAAVGLSDFAEQSWILPRAGSRCAELVHRACEAAGFEPDVVAETTDFAGAAALAAAGLGVTLIPGLAVTRAPGCSTHRVAEPPIHRQVFAATHAGAEQHPGIVIMLATLANRFAAWVASTRKEG